jgi:type VI secretion system protein ImpC
MKPMNTNPDKSGNAHALGQAGSIIEEILAETKITPNDEGYEIARQGVEAFIAGLLEPRREVGRIDKSLVDQMIAEIDGRVSRQLDEILHHQEFQKLESAWRSLKFVVDRTDFRENTRLEVLNCSKEDLISDFEDAPELVKSGLYKTVYTAEYGTFGGKPYGAIIANFDFGPTSADIQLLRNCASIATMGHAPFIAAAGPQFFNVKSWEELPQLKDLRAIMEGPQLAKWQAFRETEDARSVGLCMPRFLLRLPYSRENSPIRSFNYEEHVTDGHGKYLWGSAAFAFATRLCDSFAKYRWCPNIIGPQSGGTVEDLPLHQYQAMGDLQTKIPTEVLISERREYELSEEGFVALTMRKDSDNAAFFSANSAQKPRKFANTPEGKEAERNYRLGTQLPYLLIINRLAHYLKVMQREQIGSQKERFDLQSELTNWINQYVVDMDDPAPGVRARKPLRKAELVVEDVPGEAGWYKVDLRVRPHFKYMGAFFTLGLIGKLDKQ